MIQPAPQAVGEFRKDIQPRSAARSSPRPQPWVLKWRERKCDWPLTGFRLRLPARFTGADLAQPLPGINS
jgi:hypothetical protein